MALRQEPYALPVDAEQAVVLGLGLLTLSIGVYDAAAIHTYLRPFAASRHLIGVIMSSALFAFFNSLDNIFKRDQLVLSGFMLMCRVYYVMCTMRLQMSHVKMDGYGNMGEMTEHVGKLLQKIDPKKDARWVNVRVTIVNLWLVVAITIFIVRSIAQTYNAYVILYLRNGTGARVRFLDGSFFYIALVQICFDIVCKVAFSSLENAMEPLFSRRTAVIWTPRRRLFNFFYLFVTIILRSTITLIFTANVDVSDEQYAWWGKHMALFIASFMLPFQYLVHRYYTPPYFWGFSTKKLRETHQAVQTREDVVHHLRAINLTFVADEYCTEAELIEVKDENDGRLSVEATTAMHAMNHIDLPQETA